MRKYLVILSAAGVLVSCGGNGHRQLPATEEGAGAVKSETVGAPGRVETGKTVGASGRVETGKTVGAPGTVGTAVGTEKTVGAISDMHTAETSLDYPGTYEGTLPGADCPGIKTTLVLADDGSYALHMEYLERGTAFDEKGTFKVEGNLLTLAPSDGGQVGYYRVEENRLRHLDANRKPITGELADHYVLRKK